MKLPWTRLVRFEATDGAVHYGEPITDDLPQDFDLGTVTSSTNLKVRILATANNDVFSPDNVLTKDQATVKRILGPLTRHQVPTIRCIGLNYATHIKEAGRQPPPFPSLFIKPRTCVHNHDEPVVIPKIAQDDQADYEGELCVVIGKDCKDVSKEDALNYVAAYCCGNDVSSRKLQRDPNLAGKVPQWCFSKGFDTFAPLGPVLVSPELVKDPKGLVLETFLDGRVTQSSGVDDLLFDVPTLISYLSQGTTLDKGTVIMTGTPGGVGSSLSPPNYLKPGQTVEVRITARDGGVGLGTLRNGVVFA